MQYRIASDRFRLPGSRFADLNRYFRGVSERERKILPKRGYFPRYEPPLHASPIQSAPTTVHRQIEAYVRFDRRSFLRRVRRAEDWYVLNFSFCTCATTDRV